jgi:hypothetical protein
MGPSAGVVGGVIVTGLGFWIAVTRAGTDLATFGWLLVLVGVSSIVANLVVGARMR